MERSQAGRGALGGFRRRMSGLFLPGRAAEEIERREKQRREVQRDRLVERHDRGMSIVKHRRSRRGTTRQDTRKRVAKERLKRKGVVRKNKTRRLRYLRAQKKRLSR